MNNLMKNNKIEKIDELKATSDLLQKQNESHYVFNLLETTVFYDEADCDEYCLKDDIDTFLEIEV